MGFRRIEDLDLAGKRVFTRVDFNVPLGADAEIGDDTRIRAALPTIRELRERGARVVLASHLGRPKGEVVEGLRMRPVAKRLGELLGVPVPVLPGITGEAVEHAVGELTDGQCALLENVRFHPGETKGDAELSASFARLADRFVGDAFGTAHRAHCSVVGVAECLPAEARAAGRLMESELAAFHRLLDEPARPFLAVLGGAKVSDKILVVERLLEIVDTLVVGGGMAYTFLRAQGHEIGASKLEEDSLEIAHRALEKAKQRGVELILPMDHVVADRFSAEAEVTAVDAVDVPEGMLALDIGARTAARIADRVASAKTVVWNGPLGVFEWPAFAKGSETVAPRDCRLLRDERRRWGGLARGGSATGTGRTLRPRLDRWWGVPRDARGQGPARRARVASVVPATMEHQEPAPSRPPSQLHGLGGEEARAWSGSRAAGRRMAGNAGVVALEAAPAPVGRGMVPEADAR